LFVLVMIGREFRRSDDRRLIEAANRPHVSERAIAARKAV
jgi:hypothetical protein